MAQIAGAVITRRNEKHHFGKSGTAEVVDYAGVVVRDLSNVAQGQTDITRVGDELYISSYQLRYVGKANSTDGKNLLRVILFQWSSNSTPTAANVISTMNSERTPISPFLHDNRGLYRILYDRTHVMVFDTSSEMVQGKVMITRGFKTRKMRFESAATTGYNKIWLIAVSDSAASSQPTISWQGRLNFRDS